MLFCVLLQQYGIYNKALQSRYALKGSLIKLNT